MRGVNVVSEKKENKETKKNEEAVNSTEEAPKDKSAKKATVESENKSEKNKPGKKLKKHSKTNQQIEELQTQVSELTGKVNAITDQYIRSKAEIANIQKRNEKEQAQHYFLKKLLKLRIKRTIKININVIKMVISQPITEWAKGTITFCPKNPNTIEGTANTIEKTVKNFIVLFKSLSRILELAFATRSIISVASWAISSPCCDSTMTSSNCSCWPAVI